MITQQQEAGGLTSGLPLSAKRQSRVYWDADGHRRRSRDLVPINDFGQLAAVGWRCPKCTLPYWLPLSKGATRAEPDPNRVPVCPTHHRKMLRWTPARPPLLPWRQVWSAVERPLRPVWALPAMAAAGAAVDVGQVPAVAAAVAVPAGFEAARRAYRRYATSVAVQRGRLDGDDPQAHKRRRAAIDRAARKVGYTAAAGAGWLTAAATVGLDPSTWAGRLVWSALLPVWALPAATWWRLDRHREVPRVTVEDTPADDGPDVDPAEAEVRRIWAAKLAARQGDIIGHRPDGPPIKAEKDGRLPGTHLTRWQHVRGGWRATIVGPAGDFEADDFLRARGKIAGAYKKAKAMVSLSPSSDDENECDIVVQDKGVISETVRWAGPDSIDIRTGRAPIVRYVDGSYGMYELWRPGWGCAHEIYVGSTGSGKTETLQTAFTIGRWAHHNGRGLVCDFLIDPQQGQSYSAYIDDLAAPVASTADEALMLVRAFRREMLRRNALLSAKTWTDGKGRRRRAVKWWDPMEDGPLLFLTIDEAHEFLAIRELAALVTAGARMYRKCGMRIRIATHTPLLTDLGGSMALRDMLTGGFVWCGKTNNGLTSATAFNGRLPADPRTIPDVPGAAYILSPVEQRGMLARTMWEPDFYDWVRDGQGAQIGHPGRVPAETLAAFGGEYSAWVRAAGSDGEQVWTPTPAQPIRVERPNEHVADLVRFTLQTADGPLDMAGFDRALRGAGVDASVLAIRQALAVLREQGLAVKTPDGRHILDPKVRDRFEREAAEQLPPDAEAFEEAEA